MKNEENEENEELAFNRQNREVFEKLMKESSVNKDGYFDRSNPFLKLVFLVLGIIIIVGVAYYVLSYLNS